MERQRRTLAWTVLMGRGSVVLSYAYVLALDPVTQAGPWGGVPVSLLPIYVSSMVLATAGFFAFTYYLLFRADPDRIRVAARFGYGLFPGLYVTILVPSATWLPLTSAMVQQPSALLWLVIRLVLGLVGLGSGGLLLSLLCLRPRQPAGVYWLAVAGCMAFCLQTVVLDLLVWTSRFPVEIV